MTTADDRHAHLWALTREERVAAFFRGEFKLGDCLAWARRYPDEPRLAPDGEYLFIASHTPEWQETRSDRTRKTGREI